MIKSIDQVDSSLLDSEDDTDYIDEYIDENPIDRLYTKAANETSESKEATPYEKIDKIINNIEDQEMRSLLQKWMYKHASAFNDELNEQPARVAPYKIDMKQDNNWHENTANKAPPRWQMITKQQEVKRFIGCINTPQCLTRHQD